MSRSEFHIYNASAGSGKTFALVKFYLKTLFTAPFPRAHRKILSLTFTNKAVNEMKSRIIEALHQFSKPEILDTDDDLFMALLSELNWTAEELHSKAKIHLENIINDYSFFEVMTIDKFNQRLIRNFSRDLGLNTNFDIEMDSEEVLSLAVDNLIAKAGTDPELTETLIGFAIEKSEDDKSFNIAYDFNKMAKILINENHFSHLQDLQGKSLSDYKSLKNLAAKKMKILEASIQKIAASILNRFDENGIDQSVFSYGSVPKYFKGLLSSVFPKDFNKVWMQTIETKTLYTSKADPAMAQIIDDMQAEIAAAFHRSRELIGEYQLYEAIHKNLIPMSVLDLIQKEVDLIKEEQNIVLISEFNPIVADHLQNQPAAFIYERIGERFKHFFIDEFQDTSVLQWKNLSPLIENALSSEDASAMIVGDPKQSIYRWRGGKPEQFIGLYQKGESPFPVKQEIHPLSRNYRSHKDIVEFNNDFFKFISEQVFDQSSYSQVYMDCIQIPKKQKKGYVNLSFVEYDKVESSTEAYGPEVLKAIESSLESGFSLSDICILTRKRKQGRELAKYLSMNSSHEVISPESLLLTHSPEVQFVTDMLQFLIDPLNLDIKFNLLNYLSQRLEKPENVHGFIQKGLLLEVSGLMEFLKSYTLEFNFAAAKVLPIYESIEYIISAFDLMSETDAYLQGLLELVHEKSKTQSLSINGFLKYFDEKREKLGISLPSGIEAIQLMTIHQAKGLEFPVVIFPYAELKLYDEREPKTWINLNSDEFGGFDRFYINFNTQLKNMGDWGEQLYNRRREKMEFDTINMLYVAFTRAVQRLHIISRKNLSAKGSPPASSSDGLLIKFLQEQDRWSDLSISFEFGKPVEKISSDKAAVRSEIHAPFRMIDATERQVAISTRSGLLWDSRQEHARERGNLIHQIMADVIHFNDIDFALDKAMSAGLFATGQEKELLPLIKQIVSHPQISGFFAQECEVFTERSILLANGEFIRPDRISISADLGAAVIDYKTGKQREADVQQIHMYSEALSEMGVKVFKRFLIYIDEGIEVKEV